MLMPYALFLIHSTVHLFYARLLDTKNGDIGQDLESSKRIMTSKPLDPSSIDPLYRSRLKKHAKLLATSDKNEVKQTILL